MTQFAELNSIRVVEARLTFPAWGAWHCDLVLDHEASIPDSAASLKIGTAWVLTCTPWRPAIAWQGRTMVRMIGGFGGWRKELEAKPYRNPAGVRLSTVLGDAARTVGEKIEIATADDRIIGPWYERELAPAQRLLNRLAPGQWWIGSDGVTRLAARASSTIGSTFSVEDVKGAQGRYMIATESPADFVPGRLFRGSLKSPVTINGVTHILTSDRLRTEVLAA